MPRESAERPRTRARSATRTPRSRPNATERREVAAERSARRRLAIRLRSRRASATALASGVAVREPAELRERRVEAAHRLLDDRRDGLHLVDPSHHLPAERDRRLHVAAEVEVHRA